MSNGSSHKNRLKQICDGGIAKSFRPTFAFSYLDRATYKEEEENSSNIFNYTISRLDSRDWFFFLVADKTVHYFSDGTSSKKNWWFLTDEFWPTIKISQNVKTSQSIAFLHCVYLSRFSIDIHVYSSVTALGIITVLREL